MNQFQQIAISFATKIKPSPKFLSIKPVDDQDLLFPPFLEKWQECAKQYQDRYPSQRLTFSETYRSNTLQTQYYNQGASKIKVNGMHHYGIAGDTVFIINGKESYKGDIALIRKIYKDNGLTILGMWDPLHVQYIAVADQQKVREAVANNG